MCLCFVLTCGVCIILLYIISYTILSSFLLIPIYLPPPSLLFHSFSPNLLLFFPLLFQYSSLYHPIISSSSHTILLFSLTILINHYIRVDTYIRLFILYYSILLSSPLSSFPSSINLIQSIRVGSSLCLFMFQTHPTFDPACFIGWECRVVQFVFVSGWVWAGVYVRAVS